MKTHLTSTLISKVRGNQAQTFCGWPQSDVASMIWYPDGDPKKLNETVCQCCKDVAFCVSLETCIDPVAQEAYDRLHQSRPHLLRQKTRV